MKHGISHPSVTDSQVERKMAYKNNIGVKLVAIFSSKDEKSNVLDDVKNLKKMMSKHDLHKHVPGRRPM